MERKFKCWWINYFRNIDKILNSSDWERKSKTKTTNVNQKTKIKYQNSTILKSKHVQVQLHIPKANGILERIGFYTIDDFKLWFYYTKWKNAQGTREKKLICYVQRNTIRTDKQKNVLKMPNCIFKNLNLATKVKETHTK